MVIGVGSVCFLDEWCAPSVVARQGVDHGMRQTDRQAVRDGGVGRAGRVRLGAPERSPGCRCGREPRRALHHTRAIRVNRLTT